MRWLDFDRLPPLFGLVASNPGVLTSKGLDDRAIGEGIFVLPSGKPIGRSNRYHHRRALERFGLIVKRDSYYHPNAVPDERDILLRRDGGSTLTGDQRILLGDRVIQHDDCFEVFWSSFVAGNRPRSVTEFVATAQPILLRVEEPVDRPDRFTSSIVVHSAARGGTEILHQGYTAVQAIHFGMRRWGIGQLRFLDELYQVGQGHHIFPINANLDVCPETIDRHLYDALPFTGNWAVPRVADLMLSVAIELKIPISRVRDRLQDWLGLHRGFVGPVRVSERMILYGNSQRVRELALAGFLIAPGGGLVSHIKVHRGILYRSRSHQDEDVNDDNF